MSAHEGDGAIRLRLGDCVFDAPTLSLIDAASQPIRLRAQSLRVLHCLAVRAGQLVSKETILATVWRDVVVTEDSLVQCVVEIRRALGRRATRDPAH